MPIYSSELEQSEGFPDTVIQIKTLFENHDAFVIAVPEHNGSMPAAFKNFIDWLSRVIEPGRSMFDDKPVLLMSTSPGPKGGATNIQNLTNIMPYWGADIRGSYSLGSFYNNYAEGKFTPQYEQELNSPVDGFITGLM